MESLGPSYAIEKNPEHFLSDSSMDSSALILESHSINDLPGGWLYKDYEKSRVKLFRILHLTGFTVQLFSYLVSEIWIGFDHSASKSLFATDPIFSSILWGAICFLGGILLPVLFLNTRYAISLLTEKPLHLYYLIYLFLALFFLGGRFKTGFSAYLITTVSLSFTLFLSVIIYLHTKKINQQVQETWMEYLASTVLFSFLTSFSMLILLKVLCEMIFTENLKRNQKLLDWDTSNWMILIMTFVFGTGVMMLSFFKDPWFPGLISFYFFGIYSMQKRDFCDKNCSENIEISALVLACTLLGFILVSLGCSRLKPTAALSELL